MAVLKNFLLQAYYSYKGLFLWLNWTAYISNVFIAPVVFVVIVTLTGRFAGQSDSANSYIIGMAAYGISAIHLWWNSAVFLLRTRLRHPFADLRLSIKQVGHLLEQGTLALPQRLCSPVQRSLLFGWLLLDLDFSRLSWPALVVLVLVISFSCLCFSLFVHGQLLVSPFGIGLSQPPSRAEYSSSLDRRVIVPVDQLPGFLGEIGRVRAPDAWTFRASGGLRGSQSRVTS